jgi:hypothetical protein
VDRRWKHRGTSFRRKALHVLTPLLAKIKLTYQILFSIFISFTPKYLGACNACIHVFATYVVRIFMGPQLPPDLLQFFRNVRVQTGLAGPAQQGRSVLITIAELLLISICYGYGPYASAGLIAAK